MTKQLIVYRQFVYVAKVSQPLEYTHYSRLLTEWAVA